ncbi:uncharacterized protein MYCFIDRAFT_175997 [Pseudocercospora fijiensis CIRAD86]|uniref:Uncharacterized protein n=1 Tax=Pseudocercospora fijiensis (strain CIRAD86) TaxID=383855 RepID=M2YXM4_PSEFD|nr:uncharacterized protein MYCFIDRAFT_175997 [Pseudocercospora fijiensis CIRAD86]EME82450.1 hypothetical protein MYCFIDRAFT_175997 [Pseudocercospora fijiensis CIRAD86]
MAVGGPLEDNGQWQEDGDYCFIAGWSLHDERRGHDAQTESQGESIACVHGANGRSPLLELAGLGPFDETGAASRAWKQASALSRSDMDSTDSRTIVSGSKTREPLSSHCHRFFYRAHIPSASFSLRRAFCFFSCWRFLTSRSFSSFDFGGPGASTSFFAKHSCQSFCMNLASLSPETSALVIFAVFVWCSKDACLAVNSAKAIFVLTFQWFRHGSLNNEKWCVVLLKLFSLKAANLSMISAASPYDAREVELAAANNTTAYKKHCHLQRHHQEPFTHMDEMSTSLAHALATILCCFTEDPHGSQPQGIRVQMEVEVKSRYAQPCLQYPSPQQRARSGAALCCRLVNLQHAHATITASSKRQRPR